MGGHFDQQAADRVANFIERYCHSPETGELLVLQPWQREHLDQIYGQLNDDGTRVARTWWCEVPKKQGKSALSSALALYHLCADGEQSAEVYSVAGSARQAGIIFESARKMVEASPALNKIITPYRSALLHKKSGSSFKTLSSEASTADGIKASAILFDEAHEQGDRRLWDTLRGSGLSRRQPLTIVTTTAGWDRTSIAWELHEYAERVLSGKHVDPRWHVSIYAAAADDPVDSPETWAKANPSLGVTVSHEDFAALYHEAVAAGPARLNSWKRYHLNLWTASETAFFPMAAWEKCGQPLSPAELVGRSCYPAVDLSSVTDLTALALLFAREDAPGFDLLAYHWMPRATVLEAEQRDGVPYRQWAEQGHLELTEGSAIDHGHILKRVLALFEKYPPVKREVALDDYNAWQFMADLSAEGFEPVPISQRAKGLSAPTKELLRLVIDGALNHGGNPLLTWQAGNTSVSEDTEGNIRPVKGRGPARKRIDGVVATVMALSRAMVGAATPPAVRSVYESQGIMVITGGE